MRKETRTFGTMTADLLVLSDWLTSRGVTHAAMESTGEYWTPIFNILEANYEVLLVNARHIKAVPGRKTDVNDVEWLAELLKHGLACEAKIARLEAIDRRVKAQMRAEAHDRIGQSMALAAQIRKAGYAAKRSEVPVLRQLARDFDDRTFELFRLGWLDKLPATCELYVTRVLDQHIADLDDAER